MNDSSVGLMVSPYVCTTISYAVKPFPVHDEHAGKDDHVRPENVSLLPRNVNLRVHGSSDIQVDAAVKVPIADPNECLEEYKAGPWSKYGCMTEISVSRDPEKRVRGAAAEGLRTDEASKARRPAARRRRRKRGRLKRWMDHRRDQAYQAVQER